jgi:mono/diheme cytochrome c family protein
LMGCVACHSADGSSLGKVGPTWKGLAGSRVRFTDGTTAVADADYLRESIRKPAVKIVKDFDKSDAGMPSYEGILTDAQVEALVVYIESLR